MKEAGPDTGKEVVRADARPAPLDKEKARMAAARQRWADREPPVQVAFPADGERRIQAPHADDSGHLMRLGDTLGTRSPDFIALSLTAISGAVRTRGRRDATAQELSAGLAFVAAVAPENELEASLAVQMAGNHALTMELMGRAASSENLEHMQAFGNMAVKLQRTFTAQVEALARLRGKGQQTVRVEHVTVAPGGQAIVGDVHHYGNGKGGGSAPERQDRPYEQHNGGPRGPAMLSHDPAAYGVPVPGDAERPMPAPRRAQSRRRARQPERAQTRPVQPGDG